MKNPEIVDIPQEQWVLVAEGIKQGQLHLRPRVTNAPQYYWTYCTPEGGPPTEGVETGIVWDYPTHDVSYPTPVNIYVWAQTFPGKIRVDFHA